MAKKKEVDPILVDLKTSLQEGRALFGKEQVMKALKQGTLAKVFMSSNIPSDVKEDLNRYAAMGGTKVFQLKQDNEEIGVLAKKNFFISVIGVKN